VVLAREHARSRSRPLTHLQITYKKGDVYNGRQLVAARTAPRVKPFGWSLGDTRHLGFQNTLISNTPPCAAWRGITDTPLIARCRPRTCPLACPLVALGSIERLLAEFGGCSATPPLGLPLTPIRHRPVVVVRCSHNNQTGAVTTSTVSTTNRWGSRGDGRQWPHMPSSVLGDAFGQAQDSGIFSSTRVPALDSTLNSGKHAIINRGGVNHSILWKDTKGRQIIFRYTKVVQQACVVGG